MGKLLRAIKAEHRKFWSKGGTVLSFVLVFMLSFGVAFLCAAASDGGELAATGVFSNVHGQNAFVLEESRDWKIHAQAGISEADEALDKAAVELARATGSRKALLLRESEIQRRQKAIYEYRLENDLPPDDNRGGFSFILALWLITPIVIFISVIYTSDMFAGEYGRGTMRAIAPRPITRFKLYVAKTITSFLVGFALLLVSAAACTLASGALLGGGGDYVGYSGGSAYSVSFTGHKVQVFLCLLASMAAANAFCAAVGCISRSRAGSAIAAAALVVLGFYLSPALSLINLRIAGFSIIGCIDLTTTLCGVPYSVGCGFPSSALALGAHIAVFLFAGSAGMKKDI